jgi:TRAP transporter TAXI family solute receptor
LLLALSCNSAYAENPILIPPPTSIKQQDNIKQLTEQNNILNKYDGLKKENETPQNKHNPEKNNIQIAEKKRIKDIPDVSSDGVKIKIGAVKSEKIYYPLANSICLFMNSKYKHSCNVIGANNPVDAIISMLNGDTDVVIVRSPWQKQITDGKKPFNTNNQHKKLRFVTSFYDEPLAIVARKNSHIRTLDDIKGHTVNIGQQNTITRITMEQIMQMKQWSNNVFSNTTELETSKQVTALCNNDIDVMAVIGEYSNEPLKTVTRLCEVSFININTDDVNAFKVTNNDYKSVKIDGGTYLGVPIDVNTIGIKPIILTTSDVQNAKISRLASTIFDNIEQIKMLHKVFYTMTPEDMISDLQSVALHDGMRQYLQDHNYEKTLQTNTSNKE